MTCEHCGLPIEQLPDGIWIHCVTRLMNCGAFRTTRARPARSSLSPIA